MVWTIPRPMISAAISRPVQWVMGRSDCSGASQARATIWQTCSAVTRGVRPARGASASRSSRLSSSRGIGWKAIQRERQSRTVSRVTAQDWAIRALLWPWAAARTMRARRAICWGVA